MRADQDQTRVWSTVWALWAFLLCLPKATSLLRFKVRTCFLPHTNPSILLRFLCEQEGSRKSPRFSTLLFIRQMGDCIGLKNKLYASFILSYYFMLLHNSYVMSRTMAQIQVSKLSQSYLELESEVMVDSPMETSAQCLQVAKQIKC